MGLWIVGGVFALIGLLGVWLALHLFGKDKAIRRWPRAPGTIISSSLNSEEYTAKDNHGYYQTYTRMHPEVRFSYEIEGVEYTGTKVARVAVSTNNVRWVQACVDRYAPGAAVQVYCDPADPSVAYLEIRRSIGGVIVVVFGGVFLAVGSVLLAIAIAS